MREGIQLLNEAGVPAYGAPEQAVKAFMTLVSYSRNQEILYETPKVIPVEFPIDRNEIRSRFAGLFDTAEGMLPESTSRELLTAYGIPVTHPETAATADDAVRIAEARIEGVTVQRMARIRDGVEMILGIKKDPTFGTLILAGMGGDAAELFGDRTLGFPPLNERLARRMLEGLKVWPLLQGYRGRPPADLDALIAALVRLSYLAADFPEIRELDINPLLVLPQGLWAMDARVLIDAETQGQPQKPYSHLALRPYPEEFVTCARLSDGTEMILRPIKPEDEPLWTKLLASCSKESIYSRFRYFFFWQSHEVASRYCYIDYDRELAIVAEIGAGEDRRLIGIGRLISEPGHIAAEYAILVQDDWQDRGVGRMLTEYCTGIARRWGVRRITAITSRDNLRMISVFKKCGFRIEKGPDHTLVEVHREL